MGGARPVGLSAPEATSSVEMVEVDFRGAGEAVLMAESSPLQIAIGERFRIEVRGDFDAAVFEKLALISDRLA